jgi:beta-galactosidase
MPTPADRFTSTLDFPLMAQRPIQGRQLSPFRELYAQGVRVLQVDATFAEDYFHPELRAWTAPGVFDYSAQESYWHSLLAACPDARLCLRLSAGSPPWWDEQHPDELQRYADGSVEADFQRINARRTVPSLASAVWRADACAALARFLSWLESSGWAPRIWGFLLSYGITWEWGILGTDRHPDYSAPMQTRFRAWLRTHYRDEDNLRRCWGDPAVNFATAAIPDLAQRLAAEGDLRRYPRDRPAADFQQCLSDTN